MVEVVQKARTVPGPADNTIAPEKKKQAEHKGRNEVLEKYQCECDAGSICSPMRLRIHNKTPPPSHLGLLTAIHLF